MATIIDILEKSLIGKKVKVYFYANRGAGKFAHKRVSYSPLVSGGFIELSIVSILENGGQIQRNYGLSNSLGIVLFLEDNHVYHIQDLETEINFI